MPVIESEPSAITIRDRSAPYGCKDRVISEGYFAPQRYYLENGSFVVGVKFIKHTMSTECNHDKSLTDPRCSECKHKGSGEKNAELIRSQGK